MAKSTNSCVSKRGQNENETGSNETGSSQSTIKRLFLRLANERGWVSYEPEFCRPGYLPVALPQPQPPRAA